MSLIYSDVVLAPGYRDQLIAMGVDPAVVDEQIAIYKAAAVDPVFAADEQAKLDAEAAALREQAAQAVKDLTAQMAAGPPPPLTSTTKPTTTTTTSGAPVAAAPAGISLILPGYQAPAAAPAGEVVSVALNDPAVYGYGLPDYDNPAQAAAAAENDARIASDPAFVESEIVRTRAVIKAREAAGMETAAQEFYLQRLLDARAGGDWYASGQTAEAYEVARRYGPAAVDQYAVVAPRMAGLFGVPWWVWVAGAVVALIFGKPYRE